VRNHRVPLPIGTKKSGPLHRAHFQCVL
jgi:hypothetical protein